MGRITAILLLLFSSAFAQESREGTIDRNKDLPQIVREISAEVGRTTSKREKALVVWVVDDTNAFRSSGQGKLLAGSIRDSFPADVYHSLFALGDPTEGLVAPTRDLEKIADGLDTLAKRPPDNLIKNCLLGVRVAAKSASRFKGNRFVVLFTPTNGDNEDHLEETLQFLRKLKIRFVAIAGEAVYSDPYWKSFLGSSSSNTGPFQRLKFRLAGQESAYIEFPYGWPLIGSDPASTVPSGFGYFALSRLATRTGGKYYVYHADGSSSSTFCQARGCRVCSGTHALCGAVFQSTKLDLVAPDLRARNQVRQGYGREALSIAVHRAWILLKKKGILRGSPQLRLGGTRFREEKPRQEGVVNSAQMGANWKGRKQAALRNRSGVEKVLAEFVPLLEKFGPNSSHRARATADAFHVHLLMLRFNLRQLALFAEEMGRRIRPAEEEFGESSFQDPAGRKPIGFSSRNYFLCHGGEALRGVKFMGGPGVKEEMLRLLEVADRVIDLHRSTPWEVLTRRAGFVVFVPVYKVGTGKQKNRPKPKSGGSSGETTATPNPDRPNRPDGGGGTSGGTATGD